MRFLNIFRPQSTDNHAAKVHRQPSTARRQPATGHRLQATVHRVLRGFAAAIHRRLATGDCAAPPPPATGNWPPATGEALRAYFRSGWAFLIPYLAAYLLYAWLDWPVNPIAGKPITGDPPPSTVHWLPSLLHVYWTLHIAHIALAFVALRSWWSDAKSEEVSAQSGAAEQPPSSSFALGTSPLALSAAQQPPHSRLAFRGSAVAIALRAVPWLLLTLIFAIPGVYLELPADTWAHFARIDEWHSQDVVAAHSSWWKSAYFISYSVLTLGKSTISENLTILHVYYVCACLLLCWQQYLFARAVGLSVSESRLYVILQAIFLGNSVFSFYRYYGISTTIFAQLGAIAITRVALEYAGARISTHGSLERSGTRAGVIGRTLCIVPLIAFNHVQGLGIAALSVASVAICRYIESGKHRLLIATAIALAISLAAVIWWPRHPTLDHTYRPDGWLNAAYGFNLLTWGSAANDRMLQILGAFGVLNIVAGLILIHRNNVAGWLTLAPVAALLAPIIAIPFANRLAAVDTHQIITFSRMFLGVPQGLALIVLISSIQRGAEVAPSRSLGLLRLAWARVRRHGTFLLLVGGALATVMLPAQSPTFNRFYHALLVIPDDLGMNPVAGAIAAVSAASPEEHTASVAIAGLIYGVQIPENSGGRFQLESYVLAAGIPTDEIAYYGLWPKTIVAYPQAKNFFTAQSLPGYLSKHWAPQIVASGAKGAHEFHAHAQELGYKLAGSHPVAVCIYIRAGRRD